MIELVVRLVFSLAVVVGLLLLLARFSARKFRGSADSLVSVVHRQPLSRTSAVAVVTVGSRVLVLGTTEQHVQLLTELDPEDLDQPFELPAVAGPPEALPAEQPLDSAPVAGVRDLELVPRRPAPAVDAGSLAGSVLSAQTWKQALAAAEATRLRLSGKDRDAS